MAVETTVSFHENPLEKVAIWERRISYDLSKHRERPPPKIKAVEKGDLIVIRNSDQDSKIDAYNRDYCVIATATKPSSPSSVRPSVLSSHTASLKLSSKRYETFAKRHLGGEVLTSQQPVTTQPLPYSSNNNERSQHKEYSTKTNTKEKQILDTEDVKIYCCGRDVEHMVECCPGLYCVKGLFYHCTKDSYGEGSIAERPCACTPASRSCVKRWFCLGICSIFLPCLLCYLPAQGCLQVGKCYKKHRHSTVQLSDKKLWIPSHEQNEIHNL